MKKIKLFLFMIFSLSFISCTSIEVDEFINILTESNGHISHGQNSGYYNSLEMQGIGQNLEYIIKEDDFGYVNSLEIRGILENYKNYPVKVIITAPIKDYYGHTVKKLVFVKILEANSKIRYSDIKRVPREISGRINKSDISMIIHKIDQKQNYSNSYYRYSDISFTVNTDSFNKAKEVIVRGYLVNNTRYSEKNTIEIPIKDSYGRTINVMNLDRTVSPNSRVKIEECVKIPWQLNGYVNPREIKVTKTKIESIFDKQKIYESDIKLNSVKCEVSRDRYGYVSYVSFNGTLSNRGYFPVNVAITLPLLDDFGNVIYLFKFVEKLNSYESKSISKILRSPSHIKGYTNESFVDIQVNNI